MKRNLFFILASSLLFFACTPKETSKTAQDYHSNLIEIQTNVDEALVELIDMIDYEEEAEILIAQKNADAVLIDAIDKINELDKFDNNEEYKNEMLKLLSMYEDILENEIAEIIDYTIYFDDFTDEEWEHYYSLNESMLDKYEKAHDEFAKYQNDFAEKWDFSIE
ncbi:MAG: hypothetical protein PHW82_08040 [Bacteroidales bacterium]|nr:hypothetical protein [Bacteroidales bacterium]